MKCDIVFFNKLEKCEQHDLLRLARAFMRVRELDKDRDKSHGARRYYRELEAKLVAHLEE